MAGGESQVAFIRWRGYSAQLVATVYEKGHSRQVVLAPLGTGYRVPSGVAAQVAERFPDIPVDWDAIARAMIQGPPHQPAPPQARAYGEVEQLLRRWAEQEMTPYPQEREVLRKAADVLTSWQARQEGE